MTWWRCSVLMCSKFWSRIYIFLRKLVNSQCSLEITTSGLDVQPALLCAVMIYFVFLVGKITFSLKLCIMFCVCMYCLELQCHCGCCLWASYIVVILNSYITDTRRIQCLFSTVIIIMTLFCYTCLVFSRPTWARSTALLVGGSRDRSPVTGDFFRGVRQFHVPWGRLSL